MRVGRGPRERHDELERAADPTVGPAVGERPADQQSGAKHPGVQHGTGAGNEDATDYQR
ncbi:MAG TPA: hypothetical protein VGL39_00315 [Jatrophihabitantaceae bacterium]